MFFSGLGDSLLAEVSETQMSFSSARVTKPDAGSVKLCITVSQRCTDRRQRPHWYKNLFNPSVCLTPTDEQL